MALKLPVPLNDFYKRSGWEEVYDWPPSLARQEFAEECDINTIMAKYERTGVMPDAYGDPMYMDFTEMPPDFMTAMQMMVDAEKAFMTLPAKVRREFDNDAQAFVAYASDPANLDQLREWELAPPKPAPQAPEGPPARFDAPPGATPAEPAKAASAAPTQSSP